MTEIVYSSLYARSLGWVINTIRELRWWSSRENTVIKALCRKVGHLDATRYESYEDHGTFANMLTDLGSDVEGAARHTVLVPSEVAISANTFVSGNLTLVRTMEGKFTIATGMNLIFNDGAKLITELDVQVFDVDAGSCYVGSVNGSALEIITPEMFGSGEDGWINMVAAYDPGEWGDEPTMYHQVHVLHSVTLTADLTIPNNFNIAYIKKGAVISVASGKTLTINSMTAMLAVDPFAGAGTVVIPNHGNLQPLVPMFGGMFGSISFNGAVSALSDSQAIPTGESYTKITMFEENGLAANCTPVVASDKITIEEIGTYKVTVNGCLYGEDQVEWEFAAFLNGVKLPKIAATREITNADAMEFSISISDYISVTTEDVDLDLRCLHDNEGTITLYCTHLTLAVEYVGRFEA